MQKVDRGHQIDKHVWEDYDRCIQQIRALNSADVTRLLGKLLTSKGTSCDYFQIAFRNTSCFVLFLQAVA